MSAAHLRLRRCIRPPGLAGLPTSGRAMHACAGRRRRGRRWCRCCRPWLPARDAGCGLPSDLTCAVESAERECARVSPLNARRLCTNPQLCLEHWQLKHALLKMEEPLLCLTMPSWGCLNSIGWHCRVRRCAGRQSEVDRLLGRKRMLCWPVCAAMLGGGSGSASLGWLAGWGRRHRRHWRPEGACPRLPARDAGLGCPLTDTCG